MKKARIAVVALAVLMLFAAVSCKEPHVHEFSKEWTSDAKNHWHVCECGEKADVAEHTLGYEKDEAKHWQICSVCGYKTEETAHVYGDPQVKGKEMVIVCVCGHEKKVDGAVAVGTEAELKAAVEDGSKTIYLSKDIVLTEVLKINGANLIEINLNGKTIDLDGFVDKLPSGVRGGILISKDSSLSIEGNGTIKSSKEMFGNEGTLRIKSGSYFVSDYYTVIRNAGTVRIDDGSFESKFPVLFMYGNSTQMINGGSFSSGELYTVYVNGQNKSDTPVSLTINGGSFNEFLYLAGYSETTITGGTFRSSGNNPIHVKTGKITIKGGDFDCSNLENLPYDYFYWGNGAPALIGDIVVEACGYPAGDPVVSIEAGTFKNGLHFYQKPGQSGTFNCVEGVENVVKHDNFAYCKEVKFSYEQGGKTENGTGTVYFDSAERADAFDLSTKLDGITLTNVGDKVAVVK